MLKKTRIKKKDDSNKDKGIRFTIFHLLVLLIVLIFFFINTRLFVFSIITLIAGIFGFFHDKYNKLPYDFRLTFFLGIMLTREFGFGYTMIFFILSNWIPTILSGGRIDATTFMFYIWFAIVFFVVTLFSNVNITTLGIVLVLIDSVVGTIINSMLGIPGFVAITAGGFAIFIRVLYFLTLGRLLVFVFELI